MVPNILHSLCTMDLCNWTMGVYLSICSGTMGSSLTSMTLLQPSHGNVTWVYGTKHITFSMYHGPVNLDHGSVSINLFRYHGQLPNFHDTPPALPWGHNIGSWYQACHILYVPWTHAIGPWECVNQHFQVPWGVAAVP